MQLRAVDYQATNTKANITTVVMCVNCMTSAPQSALCLQSVLQE